MKYLFRSLSVLVIGVFLINGCSGEDGKQGPAGVAGRDGTPQPVKVLYMADELNLTYYENMMVGSFAEKLYPLGSEIQTISVRGDTVPPLSFFREFDAVLFWVNSGNIAYKDSLGDRLGDYVDAGGAVVLAMYVQNPNFAGAGKIMSTGYSPFVSASVSGNATNPRQLAFSSLTLPLLPLFNGVDVQNLQYWANANYANPTLDPGATLLATNTLGENLLAINAAGNVIGLCIYPPLQFPGVWVDAMQLIANCLMFAAGAF